MTSLVDGAREEALSVFDEGLLRGDGCFEAIRSYAGSPFAFTPHYKRLTRSAAALEIPCPPAPQLRAWVGEMAAEGGDCIVRIILTRGSADRLPSRCIVLWQPLAPAASELRLLPVAAPWHPGGQPWELTGVKTISYAPNMAASRLARSGGFDDALLVSKDGLVLEGPTFAVAWTRNGVIETPALDLGILDSVTSRLLLSAVEADGQRVVRGRFSLAEMAEANEVVAMSTVKEVTAVVSVGESRYSPASLSAYMRSIYRDLVNQNERVRT
ncbi:MAG TPA: aminotransferase class IV [Acidimicrobiia bacterium]|nr:aminotransferase class IV [Acidimicrobiia bacterium]